MHCQKVRDTDTVQGMVLTYTSLAAAVDNNVSKSTVQLMARSAAHDARNQTTLPECARLNMFIHKFQKKADIDIQGKFMCLKS